MSARQILLVACLLLPAVAWGAPQREVVAEDPDLHLSWRSSLASLLSDWPALEAVDGVVEVRLAVVMDDAGMHRLLRCRVEELHVGGVPLGALSLELWSPAGSPGELSAVVEGGIGRLALDATFEAAVELSQGTISLGPGPLAAALRVDGVDLGALGEVLGWAPLGGTLQGEIRLSGDPRAPALELDLSVADATWGGAVLGAVEARVQHSAGRSRVHLLWGSEDDPALTLDGELPVGLDLLGGGLTWRDHEEHRISVTAGVIDPSLLRPFWRAPPDLDFLLGFTLRGAGTLDDLRIDATLQGAVAAGSDRVDLDAHFEAGPDTQRLRATLGEGEIDLDLTAGMPLLGLRRAGVSLVDAPVHGTLSADLPAGRVVPFLGAGLDGGRGSVHGGVRLSGTLGAPVLDGTLSVEDAAFDLLPVGRRLRGVRARARVHGTTLEIDELVALAAPGEVLGRGALSWDPTPAGTPGDAPLWSASTLTGTAALKLQRFPVLREGLPVVLLTAVADLGLTARPGERTLTVTVVKGAVRITDDEVPEPRAIPTNPAVRVVGSREDGASAEGSDGSEIRRLVLALGTPVKVRGPGVSLELTGTLRTERTGPLVRVHGGLDLTPGGWIDLFDNRFELRAGRITLAEGHLRRASAEREARPLEPVLDVVARGRVQRTHVLVRVAGPGHRPDLVLLSSPPLPEFQIMTLLILGRVDVVDSRDGEVRRQVASMVERYHNPDLKRQLFDNIGVDNLGLGFGRSAANPILTVGKQVTRELYLETVYHHNAPPDANSREARVEYRWTPHWITDTAFGDRAEGRLGVSWGTHFGGRPPPEAPEADWGVEDRDAQHPDRDGDGITDPFDLCQDEAEDPDGDRDGDGCPEPDPPARIPPGMVDLEGALRPVPFPRSSVSLPGETVEALRSAVDLLRSLPPLRLRIEGHSDQVGTPESKREISLERARSVGAALQRAGLADEILEVVGVSDADLVDPADTDEGRARNRRVEIHLAPTLPNE
ncbi:MAG: translocation/assembly module TamB domain-containing protein [Pseudomonadota bacterium]